MNKQNYSVSVYAYVGDAVLEVYIRERLAASGISDTGRLSAMAQVLSALGVSVTEQPDGLIIKGRGSFTGGCVPCALDHRIVMSTAVAACRACAPVIILDAQAAEKSYPRFYHDYQALGGKLNVL